MKPPLSIEELEREIRHLNRKGELNDQELLELRQCLRLAREKEPNSLSPTNQRNEKPAQNKIPF